VAIAKAFPSSTNLSAIGKALSPVEIEVDHRTIETALVERAR
jgi:hypothetical protein